MRHHRARAAQAEGADQLDEEAHREQSEEVRVPECRTTLALKPIRKLYLYDAINFLEHSQKKVAKVLVHTLYNIVRHCIERKLDPLRLFIHGCLIGRKMRFKGIRYHAKGKSGRENKTIIQIKVLAEERAEDEFYQKVGAGEAPSAFAALVRERLTRMEAGYEKIRELSGITTAKGRQQKKELIRRRVYQIMRRNQ